MASEEGDMASEEGDMASEGGDMAPEEGDMASEGGDMAPEGGDMSHYVFPAQAGNQWAGVSESNRLCSAWIPDRSRE